MTKPADAPRLKGWMVASEVASALGISRQTVNQLIHAGEFQTLTLFGGSDAKPQFMVKATEVEKMRESRSFPRSHSG